MPTLTQNKAQIVQKVVCTCCDRCFGFIRSDNTGPVFDGCPEHRIAQSVADKSNIRGNVCPLIDKLAKYQPGYRSEQP
jgi:hypothetical protein